MGDPVADVFQQALRACAAERLVLEELAHAGGELLAASEVRVLGLGKPAVEMARGALRVLPRATGLVVAPRLPPAPIDRLEVIVGEHPIPGPGSLRGGEALLAAARAVPATSAVLFLVAGGGSALAEVPASGLSLEQLQASTQALLNAGATIEEINTVRTHLSQLKGGQLAAACAAAVQTTFVLSDVHGPSRFVASGPTEADLGTFADCLQLVQKHRVWLPEAVYAHLQAGARGVLPETPRRFDRRVRGEVRVLADHDTFARALAAAAAGQGLKPVAFGKLQGPLDDAAVGLSQQARALGPGELGISVGEGTLRPTGDGRGGRAQHLALRLAELLQGEPLDIFVAGSDGQDHTSGAAGARVNGRTWSQAIARGLHPREHLARFDSGPLASALGVQLPAFQSETHLGEAVLVCRQGKESA
jgi:hydroxypyruvate reductase